MEVSHKEFLEQIILDESDSLIYISDIDTYEIYYLNLAIKKVLGIAEEDYSYLGKKCYKVLQGKEEPCEFCTNCLLNENQFYCWEFYNEMIEEYFYIRDKLIRYNGKIIRMEIAYKATENVKKQKELELSLEIEKKLVECIHTLAENKENEQAVNQLLKIIAEFYSGDRAYIFEIDYEHEVLSNTYEWCRTGVTAEKDNLQRIPLDCIDNWMRQFQEKGEFYISRLSQSVRKNTLEYELLEQQRIQSLVAAPLINHGIINGFIGVDNPRSNFSELLLLTSVTYFIMDDLEKRKAQEALVRLSYRDSLTGLFNRNRYNEKVKRIEENRLHSLGIIFLDVNGLKAANDTYGHGYGDWILKRVAELTRTVYGEESYRIGGDEFVAFSENISEEEFLSKMKELQEAIALEDKLDAAIGGKWQFEPKDIRGQMKDADDRMYLDKQRFYRHK